MMHPNTHTDQCDGSRTFTIGCTAGREPAQTKRGSARAMTHRPRGSVRNPGSSMVFGESPQRQSLTAAMTRYQYYSEGGGKKSLAPGDCCGEHSASRDFVSVLSLG